jgi:hypothetical protein
VQDDVQHRALGGLVLDQAGDRELVCREPLGDAREHARAVRDLEVEIEGRPQLPGRQTLELAPGGVVVQEAGAGRADDRD